MIELRIKLPNHFLDEEIRDGYKISRKQKEIWAVELDLLQELNRICDKYNISVYADGGTLIGAIRHGGFIPWDDDIDLSISRTDYKKLCSIANKEFRPPYFFQTEETDPGSGRGHAQLRNSETCAIVRSEKEMGYTFNQGIFIDIFPVDVVPENKELREKQIKRIEKYRKRSISYSKIFFAKNPGTGYRRIIYNTIKFFVNRFNIKYRNKFFYNMEKEKQKYNGDESSFVANLYRLIGNNPEKLVWKRQWFETSLMVPFEFIQIKVPLGYEEYLVSTYGNWKEFVIGESIHGDIIFDADKSYREYI